MVNISTTVRGHYDNEVYLWAIVIRRFCDTSGSRSCSLDLVGVGERATRSTGVRGSRWGRTLSAEVVGGGSDGISFF
jgi:hypothetical protein